MGRKKLVFDRDKLVFRKPSLSQKKKLFRISVFVITTCFLAVIIYGFINDRKLSPKLKLLERQNDELLSRYRQMDRRMEGVEKTIRQIKHRDDHVYRSILGLKPLPVSVRNAGTGGSQKFRSFENYDHSGILVRSFSRLSRIEDKISIQSNSYGDVYHTAARHERFLKCKPGIRPLSPRNFYWISSAFGLRRDPFSGKRMWHWGMDFATRPGTRVYATGAGTVKYTRNSRYGYGRHIMIDHGFGYRSVYGHLQKILVSSGDKVARGQLIGLVGNTGRSSGPHLHYEIQHGRRAVNPYYYFNDDLSAQEYDRVVNLAKIAQ